jgi:hypothetical protein
MAEFDSSHAKEAYLDFLIGLEIINQPVQSGRPHSPGAFNLDTHSETVVSRLLKQWDPSCDLSQMNGVDLAAMERSLRVRVNKPYGQLPTHHLRSTPRN